MQLAKRKRGKKTTETIKTLIFKIVLGNENGRKI